MNRSALNYLFLTIISLSSSIIYYLSPSNFITLILVWVISSSAAVVACNLSKHVEPYRIKSLMPGIFFTSFIVFIPFNPSLINTASFLVSAPIVSMFLVMILSIVYGTENFKKEFKNNFQ